MIAKLFGVAIVEVAVYALLKQYKPELAVLSEIACGALVLLLAAGELGDLRAFFDGAAAASGAGGEYAAVLLKTLGTALISQFAADAARDNGQSALAEKIEFAGKALILALSLPVLKAVLQLVSDFAGDL